MISSFKIFLGIIRESFLNSYSKINFQHLFKKKNENNNKMNPN